MSAKRATPSAEAHKWEFKARSRRHAFGWKSQPAITRIKERALTWADGDKEAGILCAESFTSLKNADKDPFDSSVVRGAT